jgi:hypothetical protein
MTDLQERRHPKRIQLALPIRTTTRNLGNVTGRTRDVSSSGIYFHTTPDHWMHGGSIELVLELPSEITLGAPAMALCHGRIVRVEAEATRVGIAVHIQKFDLLGAA